MGAIFSRFQGRDREGELWGTHTRLPCHSERGCPSTLVPSMTFAEPWFHPGLHCSPPHLSASRTKCLKRNKTCQSLMNTFASVHAQPLGPGLDFL